MKKTIMPLVLLVAVLFVLALPKDAYAEVRNKDVDLSLNSPYTDAFGAAYGIKNNQYTFHIQVPSAGRLIITLKSNTGNLYYNFVAPKHEHKLGIALLPRFYWPEVDEIIRYESSIETTPIEMTNEYVEEGSYQVIMTSPIIFGTPQMTLDECNRYGPFTIKATFEPLLASITEREPNSSAANAMAIEPPNVITGILTHDDDYDYYKIPIFRNHVIIDISSELSNLYVGLLDHNYNKVIDEVLIPGGSPTLPVSKKLETDITPQVHYLYFRRAEGDEGVYTFTVTEKDVVWKATFVSGGGTGSMAAKDVVRGEKLTLPTCTFTAPAGKEFDKWDKGAPGTEISITADTVITALWKAKETQGSGGTTPTPATDGKVTRVAADISPEKPAQAAAVEKAITTAKNDNDPKGSTFTLLQAKGVAKSNTSIKLTWKKVKGANKYIIYGNKCGKKNKYKKIKEVTGKSFTQKKLKKGTYYKYLVVAVDGDKALATSKTIHVATNGGKVGNNTGVKLSKTKLSLKAGKSKTIKATLKKGSLKVKIHRKTAWESDNISVAKVSSKGKITAVGKGTCYIYAYAQNGVCAKVKVTVK